MNQIPRLSYSFFPGTIGDIMEAGDDSDVEEVAVEFVFSDGEVVEVVEEVGKVSTSKDKRQEESFHGFEDKEAILAALRRFRLQTEIKKLEQWIKEVEEDKSDGEKERWWRWCEEGAMVEEVAKEVGEVSTSKDKKEEESLRAEVKFVHPVSPGGSVKFVASGVNFSIFTNFLCFFLLKLLKLGEIGGVKFLTWKSGGVKFWTNFMSVSQYGIKQNHIVM